MTHTHTMKINVTMTVEVDARIWAENNMLQDDTRGRGYSVDIIRNDVRNHIIDTVMNSPLIDESDAIVSSGDRRNKPVPAIAFINNLGGIYGTSLTAESTITIGPSIYPIPSYCQAHGSSSALHRLGETLARNGWRPLISDLRKALDISGKRLQVIPIDNPTDRTTGRFLEVSGAEAFVVEGETRIPVTLDYQAGRALSGPHTPVKVTSDGDVFLLTHDYFFRQPTGRCEHIRHDMLAISDNYADSIGVEIIDPHQVRSGVYEAIKCCKICKPDRTAI